MSFLNLLSSYYFQYILVIKLKGRKFYCRYIWYKELGKVLPQFDAKDLSKLVTFFPKSHSNISFIISKRGIKRIFSCRYKMFSKLPNKFWG